MELNITACPQCHNGFYDLCWIKVFPEEWAIIDDKDIVKWYFIDQHYLLDHYSNLRCSYWFEKYIELYHPQYIEAINKIKLLL